MTRGAGRNLRGRSAPSFSFLRALIAPGCVLLCLLAAGPARAVITYINTVNGAAINTAASYTINNVVATAGNLLVARIATGNNTLAPTGPAGWTRQTYSTSVTGAVVLTTWTFSVTTSGTYSYTWNTSGANGGWAGSVMQYSGVDAFCPVGGTGTHVGTAVGTNKSTTFPIPVITLQSTGAVVNAGYAHLVKNKNYAAPAGYLTRGLSKSNANNSPTLGSSDRNVNIPPATTGGQTVLARNAGNVAIVTDLIELVQAEIAGVTLTPGAMTFASIQGSSPPAQTFMITNSHLRATCPNQTYTASVGSFSAGWSAANLAAPVVTGVNLAVGATSGAISVTVNATALVSGTYTAVITITDAAGNFALINVTLSVACVVTRQAAAASNTGLAATSLTLTDPGTWATGDQLVATLLAETTTAPATPAGWTLVGSNTTGGNLGMWVYRGAKSGTATTTWTGFGAGRLAGVMAAYANANDTTLLDAPPVPFTPAPTSSGDGAVDVNAATTVVANAEVIAAYGINAASAGTALTPGAGLNSVAGNVATGAGIGDLVLNVGSDLLIPAAATALSENGTVAPAQAASKLGAVCTIGAANSPPAVTVLRSPAVPSQGDTVTYTIIVANPPTNSALTTFTLSDTLPANLTFVSLTADAAAAGLVLSSNPGPGSVQGASGTLSTPLPAGASATFTLVGSLSCPATIAQSSTILATAPGTCGNPALVLNAFIPGTVAAPLVSMSRLPAAPVQGEYVTWTIVVTNNNAASPLNALTMSDTLPAGIIFDSLTVDGPGAGLILSANPGAGTVQGAYGSLNAPLSVGNSVTFTLVGKVGCAVAAAQTNRAYAETVQSCQKAASGTDSFTPLPMVAAPQVSILRNPASPARGDTLTYMIVVVNPGANSAINSLVLSDTLPAGIDVALFEGGSDGSGDGLTLSDDLGVGTVQGSSGLFTTPLAPGASFTFTVTGTVSCAAVGLQTHQAYAEIAGGCFTALSVANTLTLSGSALAVASVVPVCGPVAGGFTMTITGTFGTGLCIPTGVMIGPDAATILGTPTATTILVTVPVFTGTTAGSAHDVAVSASAGTGTLAGGYLPFSSPGALAAAGSVRPLATIGQWFAVGLTITNTGGAPVTGVTPSVSVIPGAALVVVQSSPTGGLTLAPGAATTFEWTYSASGAGLVAWTMTSTASTCTGSALLAARTVSATIQTPAALAAQLAAQPSPVCVGDDVLVTLTVTNTGGADAVNVTPVLPMVGGSGNALWVAGPNPPAPVSLSSGAAVTFTYTFTASVSGLISFSSTVSALDGNSALAVTTGPVDSPAVTVTTPGTLVAAVAAPAAVSAGQWFPVALTVTNTGGAAVTGVTATAFAGSILATFVSGPSPAGPVAITAGAAQTFVWTFSANGTAGAESFTASASGSTCAATLVEAGATTTVAVGSGAQLTAAFAIYPSPVSIGQSFTVTLTVTNSGQADATGVLPLFADASTAGLLLRSGPAPVGPVTVAAGTAQTFIWTFSTTGAGTLTLTLTAAGSDLNSGLPVVGAVTITLANFVQTPANLTAAVAAIPDPLCIGDLTLVTLTVTNTGEAAATGVAPVLPTLIGSGGAAYADGPNPPPPATLGPGASITFTWTFTASSAGSVAYSSTANGLDGNAGTAVTSGAAMSATVTVVTPGVLAASAGAPPFASLGQVFSVALTVTNTGGAVVTGMAPALDLGPGAALVSQQSGPAGGASLASGAATTFIWTFSATGAGPVGFSLTATGAMCAASIVSGTAFVPVIIQTPANLVVSGPSAEPDPLCQGAQITVSLAVTNTGQADAVGVIGTVAPAGTASWLVLSAPAPMTLPGGSATVLIWTFDAANVGGLGFTITVTGADGNSGAALTLSPANSNTITINSAGFLVGGSDAPATVTIGQWFTVSYTVTNAGSANVNNVTPSIAVAPGGAPVDVQGAAPAAVPALLSGASATFVWTYSASGSGPVAFTVTAAGTACAATPMVVTETVPVLLQTPAVLAAALSAGPTPRTVGQSLFVTLTVTNTGEADAVNVTPDLLLSYGVGGASISGPTPVSLASLSAGAAITFSWTVSAASSGTLWFSSTVTGLDGNSGALIQISPIVSNPVLIQTPAALAAAMHMSSGTLCLGSDLTVTLTVTNTGEATANGVTAASLAQSGAGALLDTIGALSSVPALPGGDAVTFTWTLTGATAGLVSLSTTVTATDANDASVIATNPVPSVKVLVVDAGLLAASTAAPAVVSTGQWFAVTLTVTNTGSAAVTGILPDLAAGGLLELQGSVSPAGPQALNAGSSVTFVWTYSASGAGTVNYTATAAGTSLCGAITGAADGSLTVQSRAALDAALAAFPSPRWIGQTFLVTLTVTNGGQVAAVNVTPDLLLAFGSGGASLSGPDPITLASLSAGTAITFTWTVTASSSGTLFFSSSVSGADFNSGAGLFAGPIVSNPVLIQTPAALAAAMHLSSGTVCLGSDLTVTLTVTNAGEATANGITAAALMQSGAGALLDTIGALSSVPALPGGAAVTFTWTVTGSVAGLVSFSTTATATDANSAAGIGAPASSAGSVLVVDTGMLAASTAAPAVVSTGQWFAVTLTVTNTGSAAVTGVAPDLDAGPLVELIGIVSPAGPQSLNAGSSVTFAWTYSASGAGTVNYTATATGTSLCGAISGAANGALTVETRATLLASLSAGPTPRTIGQTFLVTMTVTNSGSVAAVNVTPDLLRAFGSGGASLSGPDPITLASLSAGTAITFTWTVTASSSGTLFFSSSVSGADFNSAAGLFAGPIVSNPVLIQTPANLVLSGPQAGPDPLCQGALITVSLAVTNTGQADAIGVAGAIAPAGTASWLVVSAPPALTLPGGSATVLVWTFDAANVGGLGFTITVTGADGNSAAVLAPAPASSNTITITSAGFLTAAVAAPVTVSAGQWLTVAFTVTNDGDANVNGIIPAISVNTGAGLVTAQGSAPAPVPVLVAGATVTFVWSYSANGSGAVEFTVTAAGTACAVTLMEVAATIPVLIQTPAALAAALVASPSLRNIGQNILVTLTVTNTGEAVAANVAPDLLLPFGSGGVTVDAGPTPGAPVSIGGGTSVTFTWTLSAATSGTVWLSSTVTGLDANSGASIPTPPIVSNSVLIQTPAALISAQHVWSGTVCLGADLTVTVTVTNTGEAAALNVTPAALAQAGGGGFNDAGTPQALPILSGGDAVTFTWTLDGWAPGLVSFSTVVSAADANDATALSSTSTSAGSVLVVDAGLLTSAVAAPAVVSTGQWFTVALTVTNTGSAAVTGVAPDLDAGPFLELQGGVAPAGPQSLNAGSAVTFVWTYSASGAGVPSFTATAAGTSLCGAIQGTADGAVTVQSRAALVATLTVGPTPRNIGQPFLVTLSVANPGQADATGFSVAAFLAAGTAGVGSATGPTPALPATLAGGASLDFTWTFTGSSAGTLDFTTTVTAADANSGAGIAVGPVASGAVLIQTPAALVVSGPQAAPDPLCQGTLITVTLAVTNTGQADATGVGGAISFAGSGSALPVSAPGSLTLPGGASTIFVWTFDAGNAGGVGFTVTVTGADGNTAGVLSPAPGSSNMITVTSAGYLVGAAAAPVTVSTGQWFTVALTVTNGGGADVTSVTPAVAVGPGSALVAVQGAGPAAVPVLASGAAATFVWTYSANGSGAVAFTMTATGIACGGPVDAVATAAATLQSPAALDAGLAAFPSPRVPGMPVTITLTVTNTGQATADLTGLPVPLTTGSGSAVYETGPVPTVPLSLAGGAAITFSWTFSTTAQGAVTFSLTVSGTDATSGATVETLAVTAVPLTVSVAANLVAAVSVTATPFVYSQPLLVAITLTNTGGTAATGVTATLFSTSTAGLLPSGFPAAGVTIPAGGSITFLWSFSTTGAGGIAFTLTVAGTDAVSGDPILYTVSFGAANAIVNPPPVVATPPAFAPGTTAAGAEIFPLPFRPATGPLRFTKLPADSRVRIYTVAGELVRELDADSRGVVEWNGTNAEGTEAASSVYFYVIQPPSGAKHVGKLEVAR